MKTWAIKWPVDFESLVHPSEQSVQDVNEHRPRSLWQCVCIVKGWLDDTDFQRARAEKWETILLTVDELVEIELLYRTGLRSKPEGQ